MSTRVVTDEDVKKYIRMVNRYLKDSVVKNWNEASTQKGQDNIMLGNTGVTIGDIRQHLLAEVVVALQKYNPNYRTADGRSVKESTFVYQHLRNRIGQLMKKLTRKRYGYGVWAYAVEEVMGERFQDE